MRNASQPQGFFISIPQFFKLIRVNNLLIILLTQYLTKVFLVDGVENYRNTLSDPSFFLLTLATLLIAAGGYIINDYYDIKIDMINKPDKIVVGKVMRRRVAIFTHTVFSLTGVAIGFYLSRTLGIIMFSSAFWLWLYSNQLKRRAFIGNLTIAALTALSVFIINLYIRENNPLVYIYGTFAFFISVIREIIKDLEDQKGDEQFGCKTLPIIWGNAKTKALIYFLAIMYAGITFRFLYYIGNPWLYGFIAVLSIPIVFLLYLLYKAHTPEAFGKLSTFCKWIMVGGVLSMVLL
ncbi:geranylgeranylglycerol-phosphate geranylgeranyltransferase [Algivirga pacifica]|uniref:Geranylgeranylglycerol-phosphate geranylgeranyltransferase n=1 Tax=Algivirga pacifica TaxID=1162670 RepID=A0ABP9DPR5_9BACT